MKTDLRKPFHAFVGTHSVADRVPRTSIGLLGCGNVGSEVARALLARDEPNNEPDRAGVELAGVAVAHPEKRRSVDLSGVAVTDDALGLVKDPNIECLVLYR